MTFSELQENFVNDANFVNDGVDHLLEQGERQEEGEAIYIDNNDGGDDNVENFIPVDNAGSISSDSTENMSDRAEDEPNFNNEDY